MFYSVTNVTWSTCSLLPCSHPSTFCFDFLNPQLHSVAHSANSQNMCSYMCQAQQLKLEPNWGNFLKQQLSTIFIAHGQCNPQAAFGWRKGEFLGHGVKLGCSQFGPRRLLEPAPSNSAGPDGFGITDICKQFKIQLELVTEFPPLQVLKLVAHWNFAFNIRWRHVGVKCYSSLTKSPCFTCVLSSPR